MVSSAMFFGAAANYSVVGRFVHDESVGVYTRVKEGIGPVSCSCNAPLPRWAGRPFRSGGRTATNAALDGVVDDSEDTRKNRPGVSMRKRRLRGPESLSVIFSCTAATYLKISRLIYQRSDCVRILKIFSTQRAKESMCIRP